MKMINSSQATIIVRDVLGESASLANSDGTAALLQEYVVNDANGATSINAAAQYASTFSSEISIAERVFSIYEGLLGRAPDPGALSYYVAIAEQGLSVSQIQNGVSSVPGTAWTTIFQYFMNSQEFSTRWAGDTSTTATVDNLYSLILHRAPSTNELNYYVNLLNTGTSLNTVLQYFVTSSEFVNDTKAQIETSLINAAKSDATSDTYTNQYAEIAFGHSSNATAMTALVGVAHSATSAAHAHF